MPTAWYIIPYARINPPRNGLLAERALALVIDKPTFKTWAEVETLGNRAIVKVFVDGNSPVTLAQLNALYKRIPKDRLDDALSDLSAGVRTALRDEILDMGYTLQEINARFPGGVGNYTLRDVLRFMATRRIKPRYDSGTDAIVFDSETVDCGDIDALDRAVS